MLMVILWTIALIIDISTWKSKYHTGFDLVIRDVCIITLALSLLTLK